MPKVTAQILGTGGISPGTPNLAASSRVPGAAALGQGRTPSSGLMGHIVRGWVDPRALDVERGPTKGLGLP